ncbi:GspE/PulE family protein [Herminiimonas sp. CN]|uniref:GspE/PulE family protein n=1 Tax=Herminiimonas sp. CN TaxID=1349818 RepID=UPI000473432E|nr:GspE/PulE family protein [Herminiimonas sp. CN]
MTIGQLLLSRGLIIQTDLDKALAFQKQAKMRLGAALVRLGAISEDSLLPVLAEQLGLTLLNEEDIKLQNANILRTIEQAGISPGWFSEHGLIIWESADGVIQCAARNPTSSFLQETMAMALPGHALSWHFVRTRDAEWLSKLLQPVQDSNSTDEIAHLKELAEEAPVIELVNNLLAQATDENASDIHIEPEEREFYVRFRVDGVLQTRATLPQEGFAAVASRIKLISGLDIAERRLPQDGRITVRASGADMDIRVSVIPGVHGESIVMRLLPKDRADFGLEKLGMESDHLQQFVRWAKEVHGILLVTGPTGSGKSTTLYAALAVANDRHNKIITVEDPVEFKMRGITQIQTQTEIGYTFARALRAILRHDPDLIMIGEIRDVETADIAVQSALTGHMVFSTLHTNDSISAFTRLIDMGVEPFLVASSVRAVEAQRLVRRLCTHCAQPAALPNALQDLIQSLQQRFPQLLMDSPNWRVPAGCPACRHSGYSGRLGIYEFVDVTPELQSAVMQRMPAHELTAIARQNGYRNLREDGMIKAWRGLTSVDEVLRVTGVTGSEEI